MMVPELWMKWDNDNLSKTEFSDYGDSKQNTL